MRLKIIYHRPRMDKLLGRCTDYPLTSVVAGAGYGKTTAGLEFLTKSDTHYVFISLTSGDQDVFWDKLCNEVEKFSKEASNSLHILGFPIGSWAISRAVNIAKKYASSPFILCIDDYQYFACDSPVHALLEAIAFENLDNLHILLLSRSQPNIRIGTLVSKELALCIDTDTLAFNVKETEGYLAMRGLRLTEGAVDEIHNSSGGWVSAIYLLSEGIRAGNEIRQRKTINALFEENLINPLCQIDRDLLYRISYFQSFPIDMAVTALGMVRIRDVIARLLWENAFITKNEKDEYCFHPLFREFLFSHCPDDDEQKAVYRRAALWYAARKDRKYFYSVELVKMGDCVEEYLSFFNKPGANRLNYHDMNAICKCATELPSDTCLKYPFSYLQIVFYLMLSGTSRYVSYGEKLLEKMRDYFSHSKYEYKNTILAELIVISRVIGFGQFNEENEPLEEAARLLDGRESEIVNPSDPFTFGLPMLLHSEYMKSGTLDETVKRCQVNPYELVSDGFGYGSELLIRAEAALLCCDLKNAKLSCEQAIAQAKEKEQYFIMASAYSSLMRLALFIGDTENATSAINRIREIVVTASRKLTDRRLTVIMLRETLTLAECFFHMSLLRITDIPSDFLVGTHSHVMADGLGIPQVYMAKAMYLSGNPAGTIRICEKLRTIPSVCEQASLTAKILAALANKSLNETDKSAEILKSALMEAQADNVLLPFAENPDILPVLKSIHTHHDIDSTFLQDVKMWCEKYKMVSKAKPVTNVIVLSNRETEVLRLASLGKSRAEVAEILCVGQSTVKTQFSSAYKKLGAKGKTDAIRIAKTLGLL